MTPAQRIDSSNARLRPLDFIVVFIRYFPFLSFPLFLSWSRACGSVSPVGPSGTTTVFFQLNLYYVIRIPLRDRLCPCMAKESSAQSALAARRKRGAPLTT